MAVRPQTKSHAEPLIERDFQWQHVREKSRCHGISDMDFLSKVVLIVVSEKCRSLGRVASRRLLVLSQFSYGTLRSPVDPANAEAGEEVEKVVPQD